MVFGKLRTLLVRGKDGELHDIIAIKGSKGDKGDKGDPGPQGPKGDPTDISHLATKDELKVVDDKIKDLELFKFPNATIIGEPTIANGQVSDFTTNDYLRFPFIADVHNRPFEIGMCFTTGSDVNTQQNIMDSEFGLALAIQNGRGIMAISSNGTSWDIGLVTGTRVIEPNMTYYAKVTWDGTTYKTSISVDGTSYVDDMIKSSSVGPYPRTIFIGGSYGLFGEGTDHPFKGTINLNNAYLKVEDLIVWTGMDDAGLSTRADVSLANIDDEGVQKIREVAETDTLSAGLTQHQTEIDGLDTRVSRIEEGGGEVGIDLVAREGVSRLSESITEIYSELDSVGILSENAIGSNSVNETTSANTIKNLYFKANIKKGKYIRVSFRFNSVSFKTPASQYVEVRTADAASAADAHTIEIVRSATESVDGNTLDVVYKAKADASYIVCLLFLGAGVQNIEVVSYTVDSDVSDKAYEMYDDMYPYLDDTKESISQNFGSATSLYMRIPFDARNGHKYRLKLKANDASITATNSVRINTASANSTSSTYLVEWINYSTSSLCGKIDGLITGQEIVEEFIPTKNASYIVIRFIGTANTNLDVDFEIYRLTSIEELDVHVNGCGVVELNKDVEPYVLQFGREISSHTSSENTYKRATFLHFSDIHAKADLWNRICDYMNAYDDIIPFAVHTGDYVSNDLTASEIVDLYGIRKPKNPILNVVGNHDCYPSGTTSPTATAQTVKNVLYASVSLAADGWNVTMGTESNAMYWYKDIAESGIRIIAIDQYHWNATQKAWFESALSNAKTNAYAVVTCMHTPITTDVEDIGSSFWTKDAWVVNDTYTGDMVEIRRCITDFVSGGGTHIVNLCGHIHSDQIGTLTDDGIFQIRVATSGGNDLWTDFNRVKFTKTYDCFNVMQIDRNLGLIKIVRIGCNTDDHLQGKNVLCYDYVSKKIISNF